MKISVSEIQKLREATGAGVMDARRALEEAEGDVKRAREILHKKGLEVAVKKADRATNQGLVGTYSHANGKIAAMVEVLCETDFVAKNEDFKNLVHEIAMQIASMDPKDVEELEKQSWIRDNSKTIGELIKEAIAKFGENIVIKRFTRCEIGQ